MSEPIIISLGDAPHGNIRQVGQEIQIVMEFPTEEEACLSFDALEEMIKSRPRPFTFFITIP